MITTEETKVLWLGTVMGIFPAKRITSSELNYRGEKKKNCAVPNDPEDHLGRV